MRVSYIGSTFAVSAVTSAIWRWMSAPGWMTSPVSLRQESRQSTMAGQRDMTSSLSSRQVVIAAPTALTCAASYSHSPLRIGSCELVAVTITSAPRTKFRPDIATQPCCLMKAAVFWACDPRRGFPRSCARTASFRHVSTLARRSRGLRVPRVRTSGGLQNGGSAPV